MIFALLFYDPADAWVQTENSLRQILQTNTPVKIRLTESLNINNNIPDKGFIQGEVDSDVYSEDSNIMLIKKGTPVYVNYQIESNSSWGKPGKICLIQAKTKTLDNKKVSLQLSNCMRGESNNAAVIVLSIVFFPLGLLSGLIKGTMPIIEKGYVIEGYTLDPTLSEE